MIGTWDIKQQLDAIYTLDSVNPKEVILILGSCRSVPYLNYLSRYNRENGNPFRIHFIDPFNYNWSQSGEKIDLETKLEAMESDVYLKTVLRSTTIFIHEHFESFGMFNTSLKSAKNIYQNGMMPRLNINIPNWNDYMVLWNDAHPGVTNPTEEQLAEFKEKGEAEVERFCRVCDKTSFPEFGEEFRIAWRKRRYFWTSNHVAKDFTFSIFRWMDRKFLDFGNSEKMYAFWGEIFKEDMFSEPSTAVTQYDINTYGLTWK